MISKHCLLRYKETISLCLVVLIEMFPLLLMVTKAAPNTAKQPVVDVPARTLWSTERGVKNCDLAVSSSQERTMGVHLM
jgi:hypothetical protein